MKQKIFKAIVWFDEVAGMKLKHIKTSHKDDVEIQRRLENGEKVLMQLVWKGKRTVGVGSTEPGRVDRF